MFQHDLKNRPVKPSGPLCPPLSVTTASLICPRRRRPPHPPPASSVPGRSCTSSPRALWFLRLVEGSRILRFMQSAGPWSQRRQGARTVVLQVMLQKNRTSIDEPDTPCGGRSGH
uniref:Uncharacterized protein n=1 Tax=Setaria viridis TaxID=4556 RepID=A0A4U6TGA3_SETVI|nr:hypothetical protein SEVIR_9G419601v2 [Setaria viridis]